MIRPALRLRLRSVGMAVLCMLALTLPASPAAAFTFTTIDPPSATFTQAFGVNKAGQIVGFYRDGTGVFHGFLRKTDGTFTTLDPPGAAISFASGISGKNIIGQYTDSGSVTHGFLATK
jgi:probable HAF family extracellular repeat protein